MIFVFLLCHNITNGFNDLHNMNQTTVKYNVLVFM